jgi:hypothetical protein
MNAFFEVWLDKSKPMPSKLDCFIDVNDLKKIIFPQINTMAMHIV